MIVHPERIVEFICFGWLISWVALAAGRCGSGRQLQIVHAPALEIGPGHVKHRGGERAQIARFQARG